MMRGLDIGAIVHLYDVAGKGWTPNGTGPYAAIVTYVYGDGEHIDCEVFPTRESAPGGMAHNIPFERKELASVTWHRRYWCWPPGVFWPTADPPIEPAAVEETHG